MIDRNAILTIRRVPIASLQVEGGYEEKCSLDRIAHYVKLYEDYPEKDAGLIYIAPSSLTPGIFRILDGRHRYISSIITNRQDALCILEELPGQ